MCAKDTTETSNYMQSRFGMFLSVACAVHCMATPVLFLVAPALSAQVGHLDWIEWAALAIALGMVLFQLFPEFRFHQKPQALLLASVGLGLLLAGLAAEQMGSNPWVHTLASGVGSVCMAIAFYKGHRLRHHPKKAGVAPSINAG